jgi:hypothetical protein
MLAPGFGDDPVRPVSARCGHVPEKPAGDRCKRTALSQRLQDAAMSSSLPDLRNSHYCES